MTKLIVVFRYFFNASGIGKDVPMSDVVAIYTFLTTKEGTPLVYSVST